ncbi:hypothetical protein ACT691_15240 [Vibrio metschnikovii]
MTYLIGDSALLVIRCFMPDYGTARCDFPGGDAKRSITPFKTVHLTDETRVFMCHDYKAPGREEFFSKPRLVKSVCMYSCWSWRGRICVCRHASSSMRLYRCRL